MCTESCTCSFSLQLLKGKPMSYSKKGTISRTRDHTQLPIHNCIMTNDEAKGKTDYTSLAQDETLKFIFEHYYWKHEAHLYRSILDIHCRVFNSMVLVTTSAVRQSHVLKLVLLSLCFRFHQLL